MKKAIAILLVLMLLWTLVACSKQDKPTDPPATDTEQAAETNGLPVSDPDSDEPANSEEHHIGDTIEGKHFAITLTGIEFADAFVNKADDVTKHLSPELKQNADRKTIIGLDDDSYVYLTYSFTFTFSGKEEFQDVFHSAFTPTFVYADEYSFKDGVIEVVKTESDNCWYGLCLSSDVERTLSYNNASKFYFESYKYDGFVPLVSTDVYEARGVIVVPRTMMEDKARILLSFEDTEDSFTIEVSEQQIYTEREDVAAELAKPASEPRFVFRGITFDTPRVEIEEAETARNSTVLQYTDSIVVKDITLGEDEARLVYDFDGKNLTGITYWIYGKYGNTNQVNNVFPEESSACFDRINALYVEKYGSPLYTNEDYERPVYNELRGNTANLVDGPAYKASDFEGTIRQFSEWLYDSGEYWVDIVVYVKQYHAHCYFEVSTIYTVVPYSVVDAPAEHPAPEEQVLPAPLGDI